MTNLVLAAIVNLDPIYIWINLLLLFVFYNAGANVSKGESYWNNASICIFLFIFVLGSRYMRGNDYAHYITAYSKGDPGHEYLFTVFNTFLRDFIGVGKYYIFFIYAMPFILCGFKFLKRFKRYAKWTFPLFLISMIYFEEYEIRQAFGFSFIFLFLDELLSKHSIEKKVVLCFLYSVIAFNIHSVNIIFILIFLLLLLAPKKVLSWKLSIPLLFFSTYFFILYYDISYISPILRLLEGTNNAKFVQYTSGNAAEAWFGENALQLDNERQIIIKFFLFLSNSSLFYFSWKYIKVQKYRHGWMIVILTNLYIMGDMAKQAFIYFELLNRLSGMFQRMWFLPFAIVVSKIKFNTLNYLERCAYFLMFFMFYDYLKYLFAPTKGMTMFLWDKI